LRVWRSAVVWVKPRTASGVWYPGKNFTNPTLFDSCSVQYAGIEGQDCRLGPRALSLTLSIYWGSCVDFRVRFPNDCSACFPDDHFLFLFTDGL
jgi:hypothetical protein